eukprot:gene12723-26802_t
MDLDLEIARYGHDNSAIIPDHLLLKNQVNSDENIALFKAALAGSLRDVTAALEKGAKPNYFFRPEDLKNSLHVAAEKGFADIVEELISHGSLVDCRVTSSKATALMLAAANGQARAVNILIGAGANVNASNAYGNRPLHEACRLGHEGIIRSLLNAGADINAANKKGSTPLHFFCYGNEPETFTAEKVRILLEAHADLTWRDVNGYSPLL